MPWATLNLERIKFVGTIVSTSPEIPLVGGRFFCPGEPTAELAWPFRFVGNVFLAIELI